jgi:hypothetical protein
MPRKPWETPIQYNEDRFPSGDFEPIELDDRDIEEYLRRPDRRAQKTYECTDTTPIDYTKGPHDHEFGVAESDLLPADTDDTEYPDVYPDEQ